VTEPADDTSGNEEAEVPGEDVRIPGRLPVLPLKETSPSR
jgi:hypothetical protein